MDSREYFLTQLDYQRWANRVMTASADTLTDAQRKADAGLFFTSIHGTVSHLLVVNLIWWGRFKGEPPRLALADQPHADWDALKQALDDTVRQTRDWLADQPAAWFDGTLDYQSMAGLPFCNRTADLLTHLCHHYTHHRGQVSAALTRLGAPAPEMDFLYYQRQQTG